MRTKMVFSLLLFAFVSGNAMPEDEKPASDLMLLQGEWQAEKLVVCGLNHPAGATRTCRLVISKSEFRWDFEGRLSEAGILSLDQTKPIKEIDTTLKEPQAYSGTQCPGIYELSANGDTLKWCYACNYFGLKAARPKAFEAGASTNYIFIVFKRK